MSLQSFLEVIGYLLLAAIIFTIITYIFFYFFGSAVFYPDPMPLAGETSVIS